MSSIRIYAFAKQIGKSSEEIINALRSLGKVGLTHMNSIDAATAAKVAQMLGVGDAKKAAKAAAATSAAVAKKAAAKAAEAVKKRRAVAKSKPPPPAPPAEPETRKKTEKLRQKKEEARREAVERAHHAQKAAAARARAVEAVRDAGGQPKVQLSERVTVKELADKLNLKTKDVITRLMQRGVMATINQPLEPEVAVELAKDFGLDAEIVSFEKEVEAQLAPERATPTDPRAPVVTVMGHVDHGKTSLLDAIRSTNVVGGESGGITQHIGAYRVTVRDRKVVFIDTPGHEAFTRLRARGAGVTDIVVLVVAADDGVMPQTVEAIHHARAAGVPIVVAINKIDKPGANPDRVKKDLAGQDLLVEEWGGKTVAVEVSAKQKKNLNELLEMILLVADLQELKCNPQSAARGTVLEAQLDRGRGPVATVLVQDGTLRVGDYFFSGAVTGRVRASIDDRGVRIDEAGPATPVEVLGFSGMPEAGDGFQVVHDEVKARQIVAYRQQKLRDQQLAKTSRLSLAHLFTKIQEGEVKELPLILKADAQGSVEVLSDALTKLSDEKVKIRILHSGAGAITESDVLLASASNAIVVGFNVRPERGAAELIDREGVDVRLHSVIYNLTAEIKNAMLGLLAAVTREVPIGRCEVRQTFRLPKVGTIAGCYVLEGKITRKSQVRLVRDAVVIYEGKPGSLRRFKDDVSEVKEGFECGVGIENFNDIKVGDVIEAFVLEKVAPSAAS